MATKPTDILQDFTIATNTALSALPTSEILLPPADGISLLDAKNDIFLSYLQALALRNLSVIRSLKDGKSLEETAELNTAITKKLVEQRVYLEKGVRPLEQKIRFQIDRVLNVAKDEERAAEQKSKQASKAKTQQDPEDGSEDSSDEENQDDDVDESLYRPNPSAILAGTNNTSSHPQTHQTTNSKPGVYKPPRISATSMPTTESRERKERRPARSATLDEYISTELSHAPLAEPSIGSTIASGGRKTKDARQLAKEKERREYEETNLTRLPKETRKERQKEGRREKGGAFGGEEWRDLGASVDRIGDLTRRKGKSGVLEKSRKRAVEDGPRGDGIGDAFEVSKRRALKKMRR